jgi:DNA invertase Pin-like site-specific DNA recombinase
MKRVAIYARVSTDKQTTQNQIDAFREVAERCGYQITQIFSEDSISRHFFIITSATGSDLISRILR